jgi:hypothetical protein
MRFGADVESAMLLIAALALLKTAALPVGAARMPVQRFERA